MTQGGEPLTCAKKLKGAKLKSPSGLTVLIQPIGRGTTRAL